MCRIADCLRLVVALLALTIGAAAASSQEPGKGDKQAAAKPDPAAVRKLVDQLKSADFKTRELAARELAKLDEVPDALREAVKSGDLEMRRRAEAAVAIITARLEEKAFQAMLADLHKVEIDRFVRRMVTDEKFAGDQHWKIVDTLAKTVVKNANELGERKYPIPALDMKTMPLANLAVERIGFGNRRILLKESDPRSTSIKDCVVLCAGNMPRTTGLSNSIVIIDGDFIGATGIDNSLLIVRGNVGRVTSIRGSVILATGNFEGATRCDDSFLQISNQRIRFTGARNCVLIKTAVTTTGPNNCQVLDTEKGPLQLLKFSARKTDAQLDWGKEVNGLAVALTPADQKDRYILRWKNVGKDLLEVPWTRFNSAVIDINADDLLGHVQLKGPDGKLVPARQYPAARNARPSVLRRNVLLAPSMSHEETIDLWRYVKRPATDGRYELSIDPELTAGRFHMERDAKAWTGKIESNVLKIEIGK